MFASVAHAMGSAGGPAGSSDALMQFMPLILMVGIFYFLLIRPQQKKAKEHKAMLQGLKKGDTVITNAGFIGRIVDIDDDTLTLDLGSTRVQLGRGYVAGLSSVKMPKPSGKKESRSKDDAKGVKDSKDAKDAEQDEAESDAAEESAAPRDPDSVDKA
jgi:preprotein translocase subunit YajC